MQESQQNVAFFFSLVHRSVRVSQSSFEYNNEREIIAYAGSKVPSERFLKLAVFNLVNICSHACLV